MDTRYSGLTVEQWLMLVLGLLTIVVTCVVVGAGAVRMILALRAGAGFMTAIQYAFLPKAVLPTSTVPRWGLEAAASDDLRDLGCGADTAGF